MLRILKFGGSSVASAERMRQVADIALEHAKRGEQIIVVVSALRNVTDQLISCAILAADCNEEYRKVFREIKERHYKLLKELMGQVKSKNARQSLDTLFKELNEILYSIYNLRDKYLHSLDLATSFGEQLSAVVLSSYINLKVPSRFIDARQFMVTDDKFTQANVLYQESSVEIKKYFKKFFKREKKYTIPVVTGFIGMTLDKHTTTLGRDGSNCTTAVLGAVLNASAIEIWSDVNGVYSADPNLISSSVVLPQLSYSEAEELSYFRAKVVRSAVIPQLVEKKIPIIVRNTFKPEFKGTHISSHTHHQGIKNVSIRDKLILVVLSPTKIKIPNLTERLFHILAIKGINFSLITQSSAVHDVSFTISEDDLEQTRKIMELEFLYEFQQGLLKLATLFNQAVIALVGNGVREALCELGHVLIDIEKNHIALNGMTHGTAECNISFVIHSSQGEEALKIIHNSVFARHKMLGLMIVGTSNVGHEFIKCLQGKQAFFKNNDIRINVYGIANEEGMIFDENGIDLKNYKSLMKTKSQPSDLIKLAGQIADVKLHNIAFVDCTSNQEIVNCYSSFIQSNMHIISANKKANILPFKRYQKLLSDFEENHKYFFCNTNVGAGLPIISTLDQLMAEGDTILKIEGVFSGTLSYLFNQVNGKRRFSDVLQQAYKRTMTEADLREDLAGIDVARKLLILARHLGWHLNLNDIKVENLIPAALRKQPFSRSFFEDLSGLDKSLSKRYQAAQSNQAVLRYIGTIIPDKSISAKLVEVPMIHPFARLSKSDNIVAFTTRRFKRSPLIIQGPGVGSEITAMGLISDLLELVRAISEK